MLNLDQIRCEVERLAQIIGAREYDLPTYEFSDDSGRPHIEADGRSYYYVVRERGVELDRRFTIDLDDLLYWVFQSVTFSMGVDYCRDHDSQGQDQRRIMWGRQLDLLGSLSQTWRERCQADIRRILQQHPYSDEKHA